jgi:hypothetical protein
MKGRAIEHREQAMVVQYLSLDPFWRDVPWFAVPNAARRGPALAAMMKREGLRAGIADLVFPVACGGAHGLFIEMKKPRPEKSQVTREQRDFLWSVARMGYVSVVARGSAAAIEALRQYQRGKLPARPEPYLFD